METSGHLIATQILSPDASCPHPIYVFIFRNVLRGKKSKNRQQWVLDIISVRMAEADLVLRTSEKGQAMCSSSIVSSSHQAFRNLNHKTELSATVAH